MVDAQPNGDITQYVALTSWVQKNGDAANRFARAIRKAAAFDNDPANEARVREINMQFTNLSPALKDRVKLPLFGADVNAAEIRRTMELMLKFGVIKTPVDLTGRVMTVK
jgi:NitT/TauT family transport system substrate-binding protein